MVVARGKGGALVVGPGPRREGEGGEREKGEGEESEYRIEGRMWSREC